MLGFCKLVEKDVILVKILPCVRDLAQDQSQHVRASLANQISGLAPLLGKDLTIENLLPLFLRLLKDDFPDVRLNIISKLETVNKGEIGRVALLKSLINTILDSHWHRPSFTISSTCNRRTCGG